MNSHYKNELIRTETNHVGIDVSKAHLDISVEGARNKRYANSPSGLEKLCKRLSELPHPRVTCEATGGYEGALVHAMHVAGIGVAVAASGRVRYLAHAEGLIAKTDDIDAALIRRFAEKIPVPTRHNPDPAALRLREMVDYRQMLCEDATRTRNRLELAQGYLRDGLEKALAELKARRKQTEADIHAHLAANPHLGEKAARLQQLQGVGPVLAATLLSHVPELGHVGDKTLSCLVGVAPHPRQSGNMRGQASIRGGRGDVRRILYMAAVAATRCNPVLKAFYTKLRTQSGKKAKVALVAVMRKMLCVMNRLIANPQFVLAH